MKRSGNRVNVMRTAMALGLLLTGQAWAGGPGSTAASFLKIGLGARPAGMAFAFGAVANDTNAVQWNPAGLAQLSQHEVATTYLQYFEGITYGTVAVAAPKLLDDHLVTALSVFYLTVGGIERRAADTDTPDSTFGSTDLAAIFSTAYKADSLLPGLALGVNLKMIREAIDTTAASALAVDLASFYKTGDLAVGLVLQNLGSGLAFVSATDPLPATLKVAFAYNLLDAATLAVDLDTGLYDNRFTARAGFEYWLGDLLAPRIGYHQLSSTLGGNLLGLGAGLGFKVASLTVDYAFVPMGDLGNTHRLSMAVKF